VIRPARADEETALRALDRATWTQLATPTPAPAPDAPFFRTGVAAADVLVAEEDGELAGYVALGASTPLDSNRHVLSIHGLAVAVSYRGRGLGRALIEAAAAEATRRGARKLSLRVLGGNTVARALYESCGFVVEGVLRDEFLIDGRYVDDVVMARDLRRRTSTAAG
jgi:ribosomal protein S18 acetylase RimI-like enzyme